MKFFVKAVVVGILFFIMTKIGWFTIKASTDLTLLGWSIVIAAVYAVGYVIIRELIRLLACCSAGLGYLVMAILPWLTFTFMQNNLFPDTFSVNLSGGVQIIIGFIVMIVWYAVDD